jgi:TonB family protein
MGVQTLMNLAAFTLQVCIIAAAAALLLGVLRIGSAGARYMCWRVALAACLTMPMLLQQSRVSATVEAEPAFVAVDRLTVGDAALTDQGAASTAGMTVTAPPLAWGWVAAIVLAVGAAVRGIWLAVGLARLRILRRRGVPVDDAEYTDIQQTLGTRAAVMSVGGLTQPATFGVWRPVVLLPETLAESPAGLRRAVVTHELFHVQRRDWLWVIVEESLRTVLWFNPAIFWITSRIQLAREELVDELTVLATGNRKAYIEALLAFADAGRVRPAPAFARRRHLFTRILRLSKERVMSSPRIVVSSAVVIAAVLSAGWYSSLAFPIVSAEDDVVAAPAPAPRAVEQTSRDVRGPEPVRARVAANAVVAQGPRSGGAPRPGPATVAAPTAPGTKPITPENPIPRRLSSAPAAYPAQLKGTGYRGAVTVRVTLDASGAISDVQRTAAEASGDSTAIDRATAATAFFDATAAAVRRWRYQSPAEPPIAFFVNARFDGESDAVAVQSEAPVNPVRFVTAGALASTDRIRAELVLAEGRLQLLRAQRSQIGAQDPRARELDRQIGEMEREMERSKVVYTTSLRSAAEAGAGTAGARVQGPGTTAGQPVRVGGNIRPPTKTRHVNPAYPEIAMSARVQGVVILEAVIDEQGRVAEARVLRSIALLDQAALDAVRQWEFTPTLLNGAPVPIIMTVTVQFMLPEPPPQ